MNKLITALLGMCIAALPFHAHSQAIKVRDINNYLRKREDGKNVSLYHRFEISYGLTYGGGSINIHDRFRDPSNFNAIAGNSRATTFNYRAMSGYAGYYFPLTYINYNTMLALSTGVYATGNIWDIGNTSLDASSITTYESKDIFIGVPLGVDIIYGGEGTLNKSDKVTLRAGAGMMPYIAMGELADGSQKYTKVSFKPYVKGEIGFFAGVEWKLKGMMVLGSRTIYDYHTGDYNLSESDYYYSFNFKIKPTYTIGIAVFPFSFGWDSDKW